MSPRHHDAQRRHACPRRYALCPPTHFAVTYAINPWMDPTRPVDREVAQAQWEALRDTYHRLGHQVLEIPALPGLPDMVFAANGGLVVDGRAIGARFATEERAPEAGAFLSWLHGQGYADATLPVHPNEGEGDFTVSGDVILAGSGFRTAELAHAEVARRLEREVVSLELVDPRYYHLDTCLVVLDEKTIAYLPEAFSPASQTLLSERFDDPIVCAPIDAAVLGLNAVSDGRNVVLAAEAHGFAEQLAERGFTPIPVDVSELRKAGGGPKCCTLELRPALPAEAAA